MIIVIHKTGLNLYILKVLITLMCSYLYNLTVKINHDIIIFCFSTYLDVPFPYCECDFHRIISRTLIGQMNDHNLTSNYLNALKKYIEPDSVCLFVGNLSFIGLAAALFGAAKVNILFNLILRKLFY